MGKLTNKQKAIVSAEVRNPDASASEIAELVEGEGIDVSTSYVYDVRNNYGHIIEDRIAVVESDNDVEPENMESAAEVAEKSNFKSSGHVTSTHGEETEQIGDYDDGTIEYGPVTSSADGSDEEQGTYALAEEGAHGTCPRPLGTVRSNGDNEEPDESTNEQSVIRSFIQGLARIFK